MILFFIYFIFFFNFISSIPRFIVKLLFLIFIFYHHYKITISCMRMRAQVWGVGGVVKGRGEVDRANVNVYSMHVFHQLFILYFIVVADVICVSIIYILIELYCMCLFHNLISFHSTRSLTTRIFIFHCSFFFDKFSFFCISFFFIFMYNIQTFMCVCVGSMWGFGCVCNAILFMSCICFVTVCNEAFL